MKPQTDFLVPFLMPNVKYYHFLSPKPMPKPQVKSVPIRSWHMYGQYAYICFMWSYVCPVIDIRLINLSLRAGTNPATMTNGGRPGNAGQSQYLHSIRTYALIIILLAVGSGVLRGIMSPPGNWHGDPRTPTNTPTPSWQLRSNMGRSRIN